MRTRLGTIGLVVAGLAVLLSGFFLLDPPTNENRSYAERDGATRLTDDDFSCGTPLRYDGQDLPEDRDARKVRGQEWLDECTALVGTRRTWSLAALTLGLLGLLVSVGAARPPRARRERENPLV